MKSATYAATALLLTAAALWALALGESVPGIDGAPVTIQKPSGLERPGLFASDSVSARRILGSGEHADRSSSPSPDGRLLAFVDWSSGDVALRDLTTGEVRRLTDEGSWNEPVAFAMSLSFSPDGGQIAYEWTPDNEVYELRVVDLETGRNRILVSDPENVQFTWVGSWSPDGEWLSVVFAFQDGTRRIGLVRVEDGHRILLRSFDWRRPRGLSFSPDGEWLAYALPREDEPEIHDIFLLARDGSRELRLVKDGNHNQVAGWLPAGGPFFFLSRKDGRDRLMTMEVHEGEAASPAQVIRSDLWGAHPLGFSEAGFFYAVATEAQTPYSAPLDDQEATLTADLQPIVPVRPGLNTRFLSWSSDGERMAFLEDGVRLVVRSAATGASRELELPTSYVLSADWSPEEDRFVVRTSRGDRPRPGIFLLDPADGALEPVVRDDPEELVHRWPRWSADGRSVVMSRWDRSQAPDAEAVVRVDVKSGQEEELFRVPAGSRHALSPAEDRLAVTHRMEGSNETEILIVSLPEGESRRVAVLDSPGVAQGVEWSPDGARLFVLVAEEGWEAGYTIQVVDVRTGALHTLAKIPGHAVDLRIHPQGHTIALSAGGAQHEIWVLENLAEVAIGVTKEMTP